MKTIKVCAHCGSSEITQDAVYLVNLEHFEVTGDSPWCNACMEETRLIEVEAPDFEEISRKE